MYSNKICALFLYACWTLANANPDLLAPPMSAGKPAAGISSGDLELLLSSNLRKELGPPITHAFSEEDARFWAKKAKYAHAHAPVRRGDPKEKYDLILQIGHFPRKTGRTGGQGKMVSEQEMSALVAVSLIQRLSQLKVNNAPIKTLLIGADDFNPGLKSKIFLALHTDSTEKGCLVGPSVGYQKIGDASGMHGIALALAITLDIDAQSFMKDNYTSGLSQYYAYASFNTDSFRGVLEMSELTCPTQEQKLLTRAANLATNLGTAIQFALMK